MKNNEYLNFSILALIIISAIFLRFYNYNLQDFWWDELVAFLNVDPSLSLKETFLRAHSFTIGTNLSYDYAENANFYCATALPGSPLYQRLVDQQWRLPDKYEEYGFLSKEHIPSGTYNLTSEEVLYFRDYAFHTYFENPRFLNMIYSKFGEAAVDNIKRMTEIKLTRNLLKNNKLYNI